MLSNPTLGAQTELRECVCGVGGVLSTSFGVQCECDRCARALPTQPFCVLACVYHLQALRNKSYGVGLDFVWSPYGSGDYAIRESASRIKVFKNFKEHRSFRPPFAATGIHGGALLGVRSAECITFYDWESGALVRRIDESPKVADVACAC